MVKLITQVFTFLFFVSCAIPCVFSHDSNTQMILDYKLTNAELNECEEYVVRYANKLKAAGFSNEEIIESFAEIIELYQDGKGLSFKLENYLSKDVIFFFKLAAAVYFMAGSVLFIGWLTSKVLDSGNNNIRSSARNVNRSSGQGLRGGNVQCNLSFPLGYVPTNREQADADQLAIDIEQSYLRRNNNGNDRQRLIDRFRNNNPRSQTGWIQLAQLHGNTSLTRSSTGEVLQTVSTNGAVNVRF